MSLFNNLPQVKLSSGPSPKRKLEGYNHYDRKFSFGSRAAGLTLTEFTFQPDWVIQGTGGATRLGRTLRAEYLELRGYWQLAPPPNVIVDADAGVARLVVSVAVDPVATPVNDTFGAASGSYDFFSPYSGVNVEPFSDRIRILADEQYPLSKYQPWMPVFIRVPLGYTAEFPAAPGPPVSPSKNAISVFYVWSGGGAASNYPVIVLSSAYVYKE